MPKWPISDDELRAMYRGGAGNDEAKWWARFWGRVHAWGVMPRRWVTLEVPGRRTGRVMRVPLGMADLDGRWYDHCRFVDVPVDVAGPILQRYVDKVPGGRPHIPVAKGSPVAEFDAVADRFPVFEVFADDGVTPYRPPRSWFPLAVAAVATTVCVARR